MRELGIYIHIPFCVKKCYYCDFVSYTDENKNIEKYIETLLKELSQYELDQYNITTIYIGGGTPSSISSTYIVKILENIKKKLKNNKTNWQDIEITIEVNPGTVTKQKLLDYKKVGINRLSIGLQTTNNELLKKIGRIHTYEQFLETYKIALKIGFENCNVDLMLGLPEQTIQDLKDSLNKIIELQPNHISTYSLILEENTKLEKMVESGEVNLPDEEKERQMYWYVKNTLELNGYKHYEISNFSKTSKESKHNLNCWEQKEYIGLGISAHSYINGVRYCNGSKIDKYIETIDRKDFGLNDIIECGNGNTNASERVERIYELEEIQSLEDKEKEYILLGLRKIEGVSISKFKTKFEWNPLFLFRREFDKLVNENLILIDGDFIKLTNKGLDFANLVWEEFV